MEAEVFTVEEVAEYLRTQATTISNLLASGELVGFRVGGEWRVIGLAILDFLKKRMQDGQFPALRQALSDPKAWAREERTNPEFFRMIERQNFQVNTFGHFLKNGLVAVQAEEKSDNVVDIRRKRDED